MVGSHGAKEREYPGRTIGQRSLLLVTGSLFTHVSTEAFCLACFCIVILLSLSKTLQDAAELDITKVEKDDCEKEVFMSMCVCARRYAAIFQSALRAELL